MSKQRHSHSRRHTHSTHGRHSGYSKSGHSSRIPDTKNLPGKMIVLVQLLMTVIFIAAVWTSGMIPGSYIAVLTVTLLILFGVMFGLQFLKNKVFIVGIIFSVLISIVLGFGSYYMFRAGKMLDQVGGAKYKTDNMIVVVRSDDAAENILDIKNYTFGMQTALDQENNQKMLEDVERVIGQTPDVENYASIQEEAQALLDGEIGAAIYNEAFSGIIDESIEGYSDQVRIIYQYGIETEIAQEETNVIKDDESFNIYISGIDVSGPITTNSRSDVNIIMTVNPNTHKILLTTTPRDYYVQISDVSGEQRDKLTHAGIYGVDVSMDTLENLYGIDISYYARVNFTSLIKIVDAIGGVDVNSEYSFSAGGYTFNEGVNHLNGEQALAFSRERHSFAAGDNQRGKNQEAVLTGILQKAMSPALLVNASEIITSVSDSVETNMTRAEMATFISRQLSDGSSWDIESVAAAGTGDSQACYSSGSQLLYVMWPDESSVAEISSKMKDVLNGQ